MGVQAQELMSLSLAEAERPAFPGCVSSTWTPLVAVEEPALGLAAGVEEDVSRPLSSVLLVVHYRRFAQNKSFDFSFRRTAQIQ